MNSSLIRNIIIIIGLVIAIFVVLDLKKKREAEQQERIAENEQIEKRQREESERLRKMREQERAVQKSQRDQEDTRPRTQKSLASLRRALCSGDRSEMPEGTLRIGERWFLFVDKPMTWLEAWVFANEHGARLAIVSHAAILNELSVANSTGDSVWLGGGDCGGGKFRWADGSRWMADAALQGSNKMVVMTSGGKLGAADMGEEKPFVMEWTQSSVAKGSLAAYFESFNPGLDPLPPGSVKYGDRAYWYVLGMWSWDEARRLAEQLGGTLVVPGNRSETIFLGDLVENRLSEGDSAWIGAVSVDGEKWAWASVEEAVKIETAEPEKGMALALKKEGKTQLLTMKASEARAGFIVEWGGAEAQNPWNSGAETTKPSISAAQKAKNEEIVMNLRAKVRSAAAKIVVERDSEMKKNCKDFAFDVRAWHRGLVRSDKVAYQPVVDTIMSFVEKSAGRLPKALDRDKFPAKVIELHENHLRQELRLATESAEELENLRAKYVEKLKSAVEKAEKTQRTHLLGLFEGEIQRVGRDAESFEEFIAR